MGEIFRYLRNLGRGRTTRATSESDPNILNDVKCAKWTVNYDIPRIPAIYIQYLIHVTIIFCYI